MSRASIALAGLCLALVATGCEQAKSANPLSPTVAGPIAGVTISAPTPVEPSTGTAITPSADGVTFVVQNPTTTGERPLWLEFELASDAGFQTVVHRAERITPGTTGRTTYRVPHTLAHATTYHWRMRALDGANTGPHSAPASFRTSDPIILEPPTPMSPSGAVSSTQLTFALQNGRISGTSGVTYRIEIADRPDPSAVVAVLTVAAHESGVTTLAAPITAAWNTTYYWRASATDGTRTTPHSAVLSFRTPASPAPTPTPTPTPTPGPTPSPTPGYRTPNPAPGQRLPLPSYGWTVTQQVAQSYPAALRNSCQSSGGTWEFLDRLVDALRARDSRWGYNGKRGNVNDPSHDVVDYNWGSQSDEGTTDVYIIDVIGGHCGGNPQPAWIDQTEVTRLGGTIGRWTGRGRF